jgi:hypothetical protein
MLSLQYKTGYVPLCTTCDDARRPTVTAEFAAETDRTGAGFRTENCRWHGGVLH